MDLHRGDGHRLDGIQQGHTGVGIGGRIDDDALHLVKIGLLDGIHQRALVIGLEKRHFVAFFVAITLNFLQQLLIILCSVMSRLPDTQHIQVGTVDDKQFHIRSGTPLGWRLPPYRHRR